MLRLYTKIFLYVCIVIYEEKETSKKFSSAVFAFDVSRKFYWMFSGSSVVIRLVVVCPWLVCNQLLPVMIMTWLVIN